MKQFALILCLFLVAMEVQARGIRDDLDMVGERARTSYAFGMTVGLDLRQTGLEMDYAAFIEGLRAAMERDESELLMDRYEAMELVHVAFERAMERRAEELRILEELFLAANATVPGMVRTESGLQYIVLERGDGPRPTAADTVLVHYEGTLIDGTVFDSSYMRDFPEVIPLEMVIPGWIEGIQLMNVGSKFRFYIPSSLAYGERGAGQIIPPFATLIFTIELLSILDDDELYYHWQ
ncbi:MAG: FKBP-type peptidyl-prolyl cis-trans isomerase [Treponema sp.]|nr:FKBP-type peptidyl-prolyl cis-trans isomerase [Treponema sp.]